jgi:hypothetical protein
MKSSDSKPIFRIRRIKRWSEQEDELIKQMSVNKNRKNWKPLLEKMKNKSTIDCITRFKTLCFKRGRWTKEEDERLIKFYDLFGSSWNVISKLMKNRHWKQVRERFINYLDPTVNNGPFTLSEDILICQLHKELGNKWTLYVPHLPGRSADKIKIRYNSVLKCKLKNLIL